MASVTLSSILIMGVGLEVQTRTNVLVRAPMATVDNSNVMKNSAFYCAHTYIMI